MIFDFYELFFHFFPIHILLSSSLPFINSSPKNSIFHRFFKLLVITSIIQILSFNPNFFLLAIVLLILLQFYTNPYFLIFHFINIQSLVFQISAYVIQQLIFPIFRLAASLNIFFEIVCLAWPFSRKIQFFKLIGLSQFFFPGLRFFPRLTAI